MTLFGQAVYDALDLREAGRWSFTEYVATHIPTGVTLWIGNGPSFFSGRGVEVGKLGLLERYLLWPRLQRMRSAQAAALLRAGLNKAAS